MRGIKMPRSPGYSFDSRSITRWESASCKPRRKQGGEKLATHKKRTTHNNHYTRKDKKKAPVHRQQNTQIPRPHENPPQHLYQSQQPLRAQPTLLDHPSSPQQTPRLPQLISTRMYITPVHGPKKTHTPRTMRTRSNTFNRSNNNQSLQSRTHVLGTICFKTESVHSCRDTSTVIEHKRPPPTAAWRPVLLPPPTLLERHKPWDQK